MEDVDIENLDKFLFQTQITYTLADKKKYIKVITKEQLISEDKK